jgi:iron complex outermembrane recepter protein
MSHEVRWLGYWSCIGFTLATAASYAQEATTKPNAAMLEEVVVTAQKVQESAQIVPSTINALSSGDLAKAVVLNVEDLQSAVTGLVVFPNSKGGAPDFSIRVARTQGQQYGGISTYLGDVPMLSSISALNAFYDVASVSVLKGPQGTLFGTNATGGAIIFLPNAPTDQFGGYAEIGGGNFSREFGELMVNVPIADSLQVRVAGQFVRHGGFVTNLTPTDGDNQLSNDHHESVRFTARFAPNDRIVNDLSYDYYNENDMPRQAVPVAFSNPFLSGPVTNGTGCGILCGPFGLTPTGAGVALYNYRTVSLADNGATPNSNTPLWNKARIWGVADVLGFTISDTISFKNVLAYRHENLDTYEDNDGTSLALVNGHTIQTNSQISEEPSIHLTLDGSRLRLVGGAFFSKRDLENSDIYNLAFLIDPSFIAFLPAPGAGLFSFPQVTTNDFQRDTKSYAIYSQASYDLTDDLVGIFGLRYTWDHGNYSNSLRGGTGNGNTALGLGPAFLDGPGTPAVGPCRDVAQAPYPNSNLATCTGSNAHKWQAPSFNVTLQGKISPTTMAYFTARGSYQSGGFNNEVANPSLQTFNPEKAVDFEVGYKSDWTLAGQPIRTNADAFYGTYHDMQRVQNGSYTSGGQFIATLNAGSASYYGVDLELSYFPIDSLELGLSYTWIDAQYDNFVIPAIPGGAGAFANSQNLSDSPISLTPRNTVTAQATYHWPVDSKVGKIATTVSGYGRSSVTFSDVPTPGFTRYDVGPGFTILNLSQEWRGIFGSHADLVIWGRNLADRQYAINSSNQMLTFGYANYTYGDPRTFGANVRYTF